MKKLLLFAPLALFATVGDNLVGAGAKSRGVAGAGIASYQGAESIFINPSLLSFAQRSSVEIGTTFFMPQVHANGYKSRADFELIPYFGYIKPLNRESVIGLGVFSVSGMGVEYQVPSLAYMKTQFGYAKLIGAYAKQWRNLGIGIGCNISYGALRMAANMPNQLGDRLSKDIGFGLNMGLHYSWRDITLAATFTSPVSMKYSRVFDFNHDGGKENFHLTQPAEAGVGIAYHKDGWYVMVDYKRVFWSHAKGYKDFNWKSQNVYAVGFQKSFGKITLRTGYSYATKAMHGFTNSNVEGVPFRAQDIAFFNLVGFPAITKRHISFGMTTDIKSYKLHLSWLYAPKEHLANGSLEASNRQSSLTIGIEYTF
ncbi:MULTISPECIES: OmpP1/FadL family transporter [unclassified Nitratiruptor]|uniref:OmpP1/FadL family transporter n=1 Tax=unclassified Nitratiruptor TaxID=2624044 RepID=UPI001916B9A4|nr:MULTISPECIES: hypothetical protein [unclassified Nitratiruptor]BCD59331.1 long-chain fatty acid transport protein [Nitratiruptor sp. YY08-10]BCD63255.1 long-chain fatty acid transport protein [Nitratiruptor sp. YY08-14]